MNEALTRIMNKLKKIYKVSFIDFDNKTFRLSSDNGVIPKSVIRQIESENFIILTVLESRGKAYIRFIYIGVENGN